MTNRHLYIKGDGNGGVTISKFLGVMLLLIGIITPIITTVYAYGQLNSRVEQIEVDRAKVIPEQTATMKEINVQLNEQSRQISIISTRLDNINNNLVEVKQDVKDIRDDLQ